MEKGTIEQSVKLYPRLRRFFFFNKELFNYSFIHINTSRTSSRVPFKLQASPVLTFFSFLPPFCWAFFF